jgi:hypothetical protein
MAQDVHEMLELLKFELKFVEDGGYRAPEELRPRLHSVVNST